MDISKQKANGIKPDVKRSVYGFEIGKHVIDIEAESEQKAFGILVKKFWNFIDDNGKVEMLGEIK